MFLLTKEEEQLFKRLNTPQKIQDFLDALPINHEKNGPTYYSPRLVLRHKKAHCLEGALFAAAVLAFHKKEPLLMNLRTVPKDDDHAVALFRLGKHWGAISKTNHAVLRYRDPIYKDPRELALTYFHEYFMDKTGTKTLRAYSLPLHLNRFDDEWVTSEKPLSSIAAALRDTKHRFLVHKDAVVHLRKATPFERKTVRPTEWPYRNPRT